MDDVCTITDMYPSRYFDGGELRVSCNCRERRGGIRVQVCLYKIRSTLDVGVRIGMQIRSWLMVVQNTLLTKPFVVSSYSSVCVPDDHGLVAEEW